MKNILSLSFLAIFCQILVAQNVAIGTGTPTPDASAVLDLQSTDKGLLVPRVASTASISSPATGLMVYNTTTNKFNYYNGATWIEIGNGSGTVTSVSGTAPIVSSGGNTPAISISAATPSAAGSMSSTDKAKLDASTNANTPSTLVSRDASGNFSAGTITAALSGNATTATSLAGGSAGRVPYQSGAGTSVFTASSPATAGLFLRSTAANTWDAGAIQTSDLPATISGAWTRTSPNVTLVNSSDNVGIGSANPAARLNLGDDFAGVAHSSTLRTNAGSLSNTLNSEVVLASIGFLAGNTTALGIRARRIVASGGWNFTAIGLGIDVDDTRRPGGEGLWIRSDNGSVGIGTSIPDYPLCVQSTGDAQLSLKNSSGTTKAYIGTSGVFGSGSADDLRIRSESSNILFGFSGTERVRIQSDGNVGIGLTPSIEKLEVNGKVRALGYICRTGLAGPYGGNTFNINWGGSNAQLWIDVTNVGTFQFTSDRRLKENINSMTASALNRVMKLQPVTYNYKHLEGTIFEGSDELIEGFIADELQQVIPSAVNGDKDGLTEKGTIQPQTVNVTPIISVLTKAIQEQQAQIEKLTKENSDLKSSNSEIVKTMKAEIDMIKERLSIKSQK